MSTPLPYTSSLAHLTHAFKKRSEDPLPMTMGRSFSRPSVAAPSDTDWVKTAPIICICHLSWDWVWQRPQQFLSRFAKKRPVLFVETYCTEIRSSGFELAPAKGNPNVTLLRLRLPSSRWNDKDFIDEERRRLLKRILADELDGRFDQAILWMYDPMAVKAYVGHLNECLVVYDCMDELSQFRGAPPELIARERELATLADIVFCGGQKMKQKRLPLNSNCHFFGTGVDCEHFGRARSSELEISPEIAGLPKPILGYFGVIDERIDYDLIAKMADARSDWSIVMVGPTAKVDPADLPRRKNINWLGARPYSELPALTKGFSVCLMPFALNESTEYINPTKALEYMAAGKPVVSTQLDEVRLNFRQIAHIAASAASFIKLCEEQIATPSRLRINRGLALAANNTWEAIVKKMDAHLVEAFTARFASSQPEQGKTIPLSDTGDLAYV